jgi:hypothetical protein
MHEFNESIVLDMMRELNDYALMRIFKMKRNTRIQDIGSILSKYQDKWNDNNPNEQVRLFLIGHDGYYSNKPIIYSLNISGDGENRFKELLFGKMYHHN